MDKIDGRSFALRRKAVAQMPRSIPLGFPAQKRRIRQLIDVLRSLDDRTLSQIGIERHEIERFAHTEMAHRL